MRKKRAMRASRGKYIEKNRLKIPISVMAARLRIEEGEIRKYLKKKNLSISSREASILNERWKRQLTKVDDLEEVKWVSNPWDYNINLITMKKEY